MVVPGSRGGVRGAIVLDNLVHSGDIPVTIGVFVDPGVFPDAEDPKNRNTEYDAFDDRWGICGGSSAGNCAFTAAWLRPDRFRRVIGCLSGFTQMPDGSPYPVAPASRRCRSRQAWAARSAPRRRDHPSVPSARV
ncbi:hypothetical protein [Streptomyces dysideae]|uniref:hypothetical protein n=1 Tax=Streptomyces dysideae TaxID=909626 RepID=UPI000AFA4817